VAVAIRDRGLRLRILRQRDSRARNRLPAGPYEAALRRRASRAHYERYKSEQRPHILSVLSGNDAESARLVTHANPQHPLNKPAERFFVRRFRI